MKGQLNTKTTVEITMPHIDYSDSGTTFEGYIAFDPAATRKQPCMLIAHAWDGLNSHWIALADEYACKGFVAFAIDVYGKGVRGRVDGDNSHLMNPLMADRQLLRSRLLAALARAQRHENVDPQKIFVIGYCFGGVCSLDLARAAPAGLLGAITIHGAFTPPNIEPQPRITASSLACHGWEDPIAPPADVLSFASEMSAAGADWQLHGYGHAKHAFTFVGADIPQFGIKYDEKAHRRSMVAIDNFIEERLERER